MKPICSVALALAILIQPATSRADVVISGTGSVSCGKIAEDYRKLPTDVEIWMMHWAQGFMSGANLNQWTSNGQYRDLQAMTTEAQSLSLREYCDEHPMAEFVKAVLDLYGKLPVKHYTPPSRSCARLKLS